MMIRGFWQGYQGAQPASELTLVLGSACVAFVRGLASATLGAGLSPLPSHLRVQALGPPRVPTLPAILSGTGARLTLLGWRLRRDIQFPVLIVPLAFLQSCLFSFLAGVALGSHPGLQTIQRQERSVNGLTLQVVLNHPVRGRLAPGGPYFSARWLHHFLGFAGGPMRAVVVGGGGLQGRA